jgi:molybdenum cofactor cytidylyltransferase
VTAPIFSAVILAAGLSSRMEGRHKLLLEIDGQLMVRRVVSAVLGVEPAEVVVVTGYRAFDVMAALENLPLRFVHNAGYAQGQPGSVVAGVRALTAFCEVVMVVLGDQPLLTPTSLRSLLRAYETAEDRKTILVPTRNGRRGNPVLFAARHISQIATGRLSVGCRRLVDNHPELVARIEMDDDAFVQDCDTPADYAALQPGCRVAAQ